MARKNCQSSSLDLDSFIMYPSLTLTTDLSCILLLYPDVYPDGSGLQNVYPYVYPSSMNLSCLDLSWLKDLDLSCLNFYLYYLESELFYSSLSDTAFYRSSKKNFGHSIRYAKSYADLNSNSISFQNKRENNLVCLSFMDKIKSQIFTLKIKKTDENKEVNYVQSV